MLNNPYNDSTISLANLAIAITGADEATVQKIKETSGEHGLLKYISENVKMPVTRDDVSVMIAEALENRNA